MLPAVYVISNVFGSLHLPLSWSTLLKSLRADGDQDNTLSLAGLWRCGEDKDDLRGLTLDIGTGAFSEIVLGLEGGIALAKHAC